MAVSGRSSESVNTSKSVSFKGLLLPLEVVAITLLVLAAVVITLESCAVSEDDTTTPAECGAVA